MIRERQKSIQHKQPSEPSLTIWLLAGAMTLLSSTLLCLLYTRQSLGALQNDDVHALFAIPLLVWLFLLFLRVWLYNLAFHRYWREFNETENRRKCGGE